MTPQEKNTLIEGLIEKHQVHGALNGGMGQRLYSAMSELIDLLEPKWVSVEDSLPPNGTFVKVFKTTIPHIIGCYFGIGNGFWYGSVNHKKDVTHFELLGCEQPSTPPKQ